MRAGGGEVDDGREVLDQQLAVGGGEGEAAGDDGGGCAAAAVGDEAGAVEIFGGGDFQDGAEAEVGGAAEGIGLGRWEEDEVAADEGDDGVLIDAKEAGAAKDDQADAFAAGEFEGEGGGKLEAAVELALGAEQRHDLGEN